MKYSEVTCQLDTSNPIHERMLKYLEARLKDQVLSIVHYNRVRLEYFEDINPGCTLNISEFMNAKIRRALKFGSVHPHALIEEIWYIAKTHIKDMRGALYDDGDFCLTDVGKEHLKAYYTPKRVLRWREI